MSRLAAVVQHALGGGCLAGVDVGDDANVADVLDIGLKMGSRGYAVRPAPRASVTEAMALSAHGDDGASGCFCAASQ